MVEKDEKTIKLKVVEALQEDAYKGIVRIDPSLMRKLNLERGDIISISGNRKTYAIVDQAYPADHGENIIRMDGITRKNSKTGIGEHVQIKKETIIEAKKITIAPAQKGIIVKGSPDNFKRGLLGKPVSKGDIVVMGGAQQRRDIMSDDFSNLFGGDMSEVFNQMGFGGMSGGLTQIRFIIASTSPNKPCIITENTAITLNPKAVEISEESIPQITYEDIGGLTEEVKKVREMVELPLKRPEIFMRLGIEPPKGVLLYGPPGTGKTLLARVVASESEAHFIAVNGPEIHNALLGGSEKKIREIFDEAEKNSPSIIFIDEIDAIAPKREDSHGEVERRVVSQLLTMMDGLQSRGKVVVIAATNRPNSIDPALRRAGRFDREVSISIPDKKSRLEILKIHTRGMPLTKSVNLEEITSRTHGFVGADLASLAKEAAMELLKRNIDKFNLEKYKDEEIPGEILDNLKIGKKDFEKALKIVRPSAMREVLVETPNIKWNDVGGMEGVKQDLKEAVEWPLKFPKSFERMGVSPPKGVLLYGPPGTGKTLLAKAVANESEANFISVKGPELLSKWIDESHRIVRKFFNRAREVSPCIIFFDEIDSIGSHRGINTSSSQETGKALNQLLTEMDGLNVSADILIIGATNRPDILDPALLRPGRFDRIVYVPVPEQEGRLQILKIHTSKMPLDKSVDLEKLSEETEGYTGADIESLAREAAMLALRENIEAKKVKKEHFLKAMEKVQPSVSKNDQERYKQVESKYLKSAKAALINSSASYTG
ncbi:CDC48 family AAA ATPase [Candidatus Pacearchaeota archaeon]|nr:CDC48 family AAA ATPase [Candidatus Pacearchaeota archaeon]